MIFLFFFFLSGSLIFTYFHPCSVFVCFPPFVLCLGVARGVARVHVAADTQINEGEIKKPKKTQLHLIQFKYIKIWIFVRWGLTSGSAEPPPIIIIIIIISAEQRFRRVRGDYEALPSVVWIHGVLLLAVLVMVKGLFFFFFFAF